MVKKTLNLTRKEKNYIIGELYCCLTSVRQGGGNPSLRTINSWKAGLEDKQFDMEKDEFNLNISILKKLLNRKD